MKFVWQLVNPEDGIRTQAFTGTIEEIAKITMDVEKDPYLLLLATIPNDPEKDMEFVTAPMYLLSTIRKMYNIELEKTEQSEQDLYKNADQKIDETETIQED